MKLIKHYISTAVRNPKKVLLKIDQKVFGGRIMHLKNRRNEKKRLAEEKFRLEHPEEWFDKKVNEKLKCHPIIGQQVFAVKDIILAQFVDGEAVFYDIAVRLLAIEQYYGKNDIGYDLYSRMQERAGNGSFWLPRFIKLMQSFKTNGYDNSSIDLDEHLSIMDGAHRLSLVLYHNVESLPAVIHQGTITRRWNYNLFWELGFTATEMQIIQKKAIELFAFCKYQYVGAIWPSAFHLSDEIINEINTYLHITNTSIQTTDC